MTVGEFFKQNNRLAIAFSGGADSAYLIWEAKNHGADFKAYFVKTCFQPEFELRDAVKLAELLDFEFEVINIDILSRAEIAENTPLRCYYCKKVILSAILEKAAADGYNIIADGTNLSDSAADRPGMKALAEHGVISPLRLCSLTKDEIIKRARQAGLFTADKPSYSCLATRVKAGREITADLLAKIEMAENLFFERGYSDFRVRVRGNTAELEINAADNDKFARDKQMLKGELLKIFDAVGSDVKRR